MLVTYRRHTKACPHKSRSYWRCQCPIWVQGTLRGKPIRRALDVTSREAATNLVAAWNVTGEIEAVQPVHEEPPRIDAAVTRYLEDARARHLADATISKLTTIFEKQFLSWAKNKGLRYLTELTRERLTSWRSSWKDEALAASKKYQRVVGFFYFCVRMKWIVENPMKSLHPPKVRQNPTLPFTSEEVNVIVSACDAFPIKGVHGNGNRQRMRAMVLLHRLTTCARSVLLPSVTTAADRERTPAPRARAQMHPTTRLHRADSFSSSTLDISTRMCESPPTTGGRSSASRPVLLESLGPPEAFSFRPAPSAYRTLSSALTRAMMLLDQVVRFSAPSRDRRHPLRVHELVELLCAEIRVGRQEFQHLSSRGGQNIAL